MFFIFQINIDYQMREATAKRAQDPTHTSFDEAQKTVYILMERDSYPRFLKSKAYLNLLNQLQTNTSKWSVWGSEEPSRLCVKYLVERSFRVAGSRQGEPRLGRRGMRQMQTAPQPRGRRIKAGEAVTRVKAAQGENPLLPYTMESRQDMDTIYCLNYTVNIVPSLRFQRTADY